MGTRKLMLLGGACGAGFVALGLAVRGQPPGVDRWVVDHVSVTPDSAAGRVAQALSGATVLCCLAVFVVVVVRVWWRRPGWGGGLAWSVGLLVACGALIPLQAVFDRAGPPGQAGVVTFPSGHATVAAALAAATIVIAAVYRPRWLPWVVAAQVSALALTVASRVVLLEHYVTDVVGAVLGVAALALALTPVVLRVPDQPHATGPNHTRA